MKVNGLHSLRLKISQIAQTALKINTQIVEMNIFQVLFSNEWGPALSFFVAGACKH